MCRVCHFSYLRKTKQGGPSLQNVGYSCETKIFIRKPAEVSAIRILTVEILHAKYPNLPPPQKKIFPNSIRKKAL